MQPARFIALDHPAELSRPDTATWKILIAACGKPRAECDKDGIQFTVPDKIMPGWLFLGGILFVGNDQINDIGQDKHVQIQTFSAT